MGASLDIAGSLGVLLPLYAHLGLRKSPDMVLERAKGIQKEGKEYKLNLRGYYILWKWITL